jgi:uncharacterized protein YggE
MKRDFLRLIIAIASFTAPVSVLSAQETAQCRPLVSTTGSAEIRVAPNLADLSFEVEVRNADLTKARTEQAERVSKVLATLRSAGIKESELQTSQIAIVPNYGNREADPFGADGRRLVESATARFYSVSQSISCTLHDVKKLANVTADAVAAGVTGIQGATLRTSDLRKYRDQARAQAIRAAKEKAVALAGELGAKVGRPFSITESPEYGGSSMFNEGNYQRTASAGPAGEGDQPAFAPGTVSVSAHVSVSFLLE